MMPWLNARVIKNIIFEKTLDSALKVRDGIKSFERDSVLFDKIIYSCPFLLLFCGCCQNSGKLRVLDFGGVQGVVISKIRSS